MKRDVMTLNDNFFLGTFPCNVNHVLQKKLQRLANSGTAKKNKKVTKQLNDNISMTLNFFKKIVKKFIEQMDFYNCKKLKTVMSRHLVFTLKFNSLSYQLKKNLPIFN